MSHDELLAELDSQIESSKAVGCDCKSCDNAIALRAVVELHKPYYNEGLTVGHCKGCQTTLDNITRHVSYPCPTIQTIERECDVNG